MSPAYRDYDVIVVGSRVAGAATARLLALAGMKVLVLDRSARGADTISTHAMLGPGVTLLSLWGILPAVVSAGTPPVTSSAFHYLGHESVLFDLTGRPLYAPRRTLLDPLLADAAVDAGAEVVFGARVLELSLMRDGSVDGVVIEGAEGSIRLRSRLVIGADGVHSFVARTVGAPVTTQADHSAAAIMAYFEDIVDVGYRWHFANHSASGAIPTNDGFTHVFSSVSTERFRSSLRNDIATGFHLALCESAPDLADQVSAANRVSRFRSFPGVPGFTKRPWGPGWALVGDAGAFTDPMAAHGMTAALRDAALCATAAVTALSDPAASREAWMAYERARDEVTVPFNSALDSIVSYRYPMETVQQAHVALSALIRRELDALGDVDRTAAA